MSEKNEVLTYKGHPLMRKDNLVYYGSMADEFIVMLQILETKKLDDLELAERQCGNEIALEDLHISHSCFSFVQKKKRPARGLLPRLSTHSRAFRRLRRNFRAM
mgnify:FL=1